MKWNKPDHTHEVSDTLFKHTPNKLRQYASNMFNSPKCKNMSHGASNILRMITWARGDNWRCNHLKSERKHHK